MAIVLGIIGLVLLIALAAFLAASETSHEGRPHKGPLPR